MKAAHQLPLLIDLFIFIYLLRKKKKREHSLYPSCDQSQTAGILGMYILIEKKTLKNLKGTAFEHQVTRYCCSCKTTARIEMLGMYHSATASREVEQVNWFSLQNVMGLTFTL